MTGNVFISDYPYCEITYTLEDLTGKPYTQGRVTIEKKTGDTVGRVYLDTTQNYFDSVVLRATSRGSATITIQYNIRVCGKETIQVLQSPLDLSYVFNTGDKNFSLDTLFNSTDISNCPIASYETVTYTSSF